MTMEQDQEQMQGALYVAVDDGNKIIAMERSRRGDEGFRALLDEFTDYAANCGAIPSVLFFDIRTTDAALLPRIEAADDLWVHEIPLSAPDDTDSGLNDLLEQLLAHRTFLLEQAKTKQVTLRLYVRSSRAHITYSLMPETLQKLNEIGLPLELSSLSWGEFGV